MWKILNFLPKADGGGGGGLQAVGNFKIYGRKNGLELFDIGALKYLVNVVKKLTIYSVFISHVSGYDQSEFRSTSILPKIMVSFILGRISRSLN